MEGKDLDSAFLKVIEQDLKILYILSRSTNSTQVFRHSQILELNKKYPGIIRSSPRTFYKAYNKLLDYGLIQKSPDFTAKQRYNGYKITDLGNKFLVFCLKHFKGPSSVYSPPVLEIFWQGFQKLITLPMKPKISQIPNEYVQDNVQNEIKNQPYQRNSQLHPLNGLNSGENPVDREQRSISQDSVMKFDTGLDSDSQFDYDYDSDDDPAYSNGIEGEMNEKQEFDEEEIPEIEEPVLSPEEEEELYYQSLSNIDFLNYFIQRNSEELNSGESEKWDVFWRHVQARSLDADEKHTYFLEIISLNPAYQSLSGIKELSELFHLNESNFNILYDIILKNPRFRQFRDLILGFLVELIYSKLDQHQLELSDYFRFLGRDFQILQFIHYPIYLYFKEMNFAQAMKYITKSKEHLKKTTEHCFRYELKIRLILRQYSQLEQLITEELIQKGRQINSENSYNSEEIWYLIFRVYYESSESGESGKSGKSGNLEKFLELPNLDPNWKRIAEFELDSRNNPDTFFSLSKFKEVYSPVCPFFTISTNTNWELVSFFLKRIEQELELRKSLEPQEIVKRKLVTHLYVPYFANWLHKMDYLSGNSDRLGENLIASCLKFPDEALNGLYSDFLSVYEEILQKSIDWIGDNQNYQNILDKIALMRSEQIEKMSEMDIET